MRQGCYKLGFYHDRNYCYEVLVHLKMYGNLALILSKFLEFLVPIGTAKCWGGMLVVHASFYSTREEI